MRKKKLGFALGAGGARGIAHIGFLQAMEEAGIKPDYISGCSMGSIVGMAYASGMPVEKMKDLALSLKLVDLLDLTAKPGGMFDTRKIKKFLEKHIGNVQFSDLKIPFRCVAVDLHTQQLVELSDGDAIEAAIASSCIPGVFKPIHRGPYRLVDGGVLERVPVRTLKDMGANKIVAVDVVGQKPCREKMPTSMGMLLDVFDLIDNHNTARNRQDNKKMIDVWLEPELGMMSQYKVKDTRFAYEKGYEIGKANAEKIAKLI